MIMITTEDKEVIGLKHIIVFYLHHWKAFAVAFAVSLVPAVLYLALYPKTYEIVSSIQIQDESDLMSSGSLGLGEAAGLMKSFGLGGASGGSVNIDDELVVLQSNALFNKMVLELGLNVEYYKPHAWSYKLYDESPLRITADTSTFISLKEDITLNVASKNEKVEVKSKVGKKERIFTFTSMPALIQLDEGDFTLDYVGSEKGLSKGVDMEIVIRPTRWVAEELSEEVVMEEYSKISNVIELSCRDYEKQRGIDMLTSLVNNYNNRADKVKKEEGEKALAFLEGRISNVIRDLGDVEGTIEAYKIKNQLTDLEYDIQFYTEQMKELQTKIIEVEAQTHVIDMMDVYVKNPANKYNVVPSLLSSQDGEKGSALTAYNEALIERARMLQNSEENNPLIASMEERIDKLRKGVYLSITNARSGLQITIDDLKAKEKAIYNKMSNVPTQERQYIDFKRQQEILQGVYLILLQKREEIALSTGQDKVKARIVDVAYVKQLPVGPRKLFAAIGVFIFTLIIPIGYLFTKEQLAALLKAFKESKVKK